MDAEEDHLAFCRNMQMALLRLVTNPAVTGRDALSRRQAWEMVERLMMDRRGGFLVEPDGLQPLWMASSKRDDTNNLLWTDDYLAAYAQAADADRHPRPGPSRTLPVRASPGARVIRGLPAVSDGPGFSARRLWPAGFSTGRRTEPVQVRGSDSPSRSRLAHEASPGVGRVATYAQHCRGESGPLLATLS
jgi:hypothetical protein